MAIEPIKLVAETGQYQAAMKEAATATRELMTSEKDLSVALGVVKGAAEEKKRVLQAMGVTEREYDEAQRLLRKGMLDKAEAAKAAGDSFKNFKGVAKESVEVLLNATDSTGQLAGVIRGSMNPAFLAAGVAALGIGAAVAAWKEKQEAMNAVLHDGIGILQSHVDKLREYAKIGGILNEQDERRIRNSQILYGEEHKKEMASGAEKEQRLLKEHQFYREAEAMHRAAIARGEDREKQLTHFARERERVERELLKVQAANRRHREAAGLQEQERDELAGRTMVQTQVNTSNRILAGRLGAFDQETMALKKKLSIEMGESKEFAAEWLRLEKAREVQRTVIVKEEAERARAAREAADRRETTKVTMGQADFGAGRGMAERIAAENKEKDAILQIQMQKLRLTSRNEEEYTRGYFRILGERRKLFAADSKEVVAIDLEVKQKLAEANNRARLAYDRMEALKVQSTRKALGVIAQMTSQSNNRYVRMIGAAAQIFQAYEVMKTEIKAIQEATRTSIAATNAATGMAQKAAMSGAEIGVDTAAGAIGSYKAMAGIPYVGPILGFIAAAAAIVYGQQQAAKAKAAAASFQAHGGQDNTQSASYNLIAGEMVIDPLAGSTGRALVELARRGTEKPRSMGGAKIVFNGPVYGGRAGVKQLARAVRSAAAYGVR